MLSAAGILLLVAGAILTFAVDRDVEGVDLQLVGWILMAGGGLALVTAIVRGAAVESATRRARVVDGDEERRAA